LKIGVVASMEGAEPDHVGDSAELAQRFFASIVQADGVEHDELFSLANHGHVSADGEQRRGPERSAQQEQIGRKLLQRAVRLRWTMTSHDGLLPGLWPFAQARNAERSVLALLYVPLEDDSFARRVPYRGRYGRPTRRTALPSVGLRAQVRPPCAAPIPLTLAAPPSSFCNARSIGVAELPRQRSKRTVAMRPCSTREANRAREDAAPLCRQPRFDAGDRAGDLGRLGVVPLTLVKAVGARIHRQA
jgi:hypothetical protein